ncbi:sigma-70 family RNA polymerase sigma factor [Bacillus seohaeanensis]|jgi:RNA polymerase sigma factor (sigma-70 family)|uniref:Sigma-70 family RNA polymerase sigma factor n=1 Tax=Bacillus seohaeanensis TaxID=284580 RepID=A0ABW5RQG3_9BACI
MKLEKGTWTMTVIKDCKGTLSDFKKENPRLMENKVMVSFLSRESNLKIFEKAICNSNSHSIRKLDQAFKEHYFILRFTSYLSTMIHFNSVNFDKKQRKNRERNLLTLDQSQSENENSSLLELVPEETRDNLPEEAFEDSLGKLEDIVSDTRLYDSLSCLTINQREILTLAYIHGLKDVEIAKILNKSQQAISKSHQKALNNIREFYNNLE